MFNVPGMVEKINRDTIPVMINATDQGFPEGIPVLKFWEDSWKTNPWGRMTYGHFMIFEGTGQQIYAASGCQCREVMIHHDPYRHSIKHFDDGIRHFKRAQVLASRAAKGNESARKSLEELNARRDFAVKDLYRCMHDTRLHTARFLLDWGAAPWRKVLKVLTPRKPGDQDPLGANMRNAALQMLGDFVINDAPFAENLKGHVDTMYRIGAQEDAILAFKIAKGTNPDFSKIPVPPTLRKRAAWSLGVITGQGWDKDQDDLVTLAQAFWRQHKDDPQYAVEPELAPRIDMGPLIAGAGSR